MNTEKLYIAPEQLYRIGNNSSPQTTKLRLNELSMYEMNGIKHVRADGRGISLFNKEGLDAIALSGWVWEIDQGAQFPPGLKLIRDNQPLGHYTLTPTHNMLLSEYVSLLEKVALRCKKLFKKKA
ncbi:MAG: hypothetical protein K0U59_02945 [Gammaproteobacteria bacterium]|nr:hypothetical protein [Gammaproteobacteria bacterium]